MLKRIAARYLWFSPLTFVALAPLYHAVSFWAGLAGGIVHFALIVAAIYSIAASTNEEDARGCLLGAALLVIGGGVIWAAGPSGPPNPKELSVAMFNQAGLTLGFFITLLGLAASIQAFHSLRDRALSSVAGVSFALMLVLWIIGASLRIAVFRSPLINLPPAQTPEAFVILRDFANLTFISMAIAGYLSGFAIAEAAIRSGWVRRRAGRLMSIYSLIGMLAFPLSQSLMTGSSVGDIPWFVWLMVPWLPPAMMCLVPYYVGVLGLRQAAARKSELLPEARNHVSR